MESCKIEGSPSSTAATMEEKLSSANTISAADLATAVPDPMAIPISAFFRAGASFTPSPVCNPTVHGVSNRSARQNNPVYKQPKLNVNIAALPEVHNVNRKQY